LEDAAAAPGIEDEAGVKGLAVRGDDDAIVLAEGGSAGGGEVEIEGAWMQGVQCGEESLTPLVAEALLTEASVHEEVVHPGELRRTPFTIELSRTLDGGGSEGGGFFGGNGWAQCFEVSGEFTGSCLASGG
jgi:hypothetical protein